MRLRSSIHVKKHGSFLSSVGIASSHLLGAGVTGEGKGRVLHLPAMRLQTVCLYLNAKGLGILGMGLDSFCKQNCEDSFFGIHPVCTPFLQYLCIVVTLYRGDARQ